jgi:hypothetical protein
MRKMFQNASSLKPLEQLKPNCPGMFIGRSSTKFMFFHVDRKSKMAAGITINIKNTKFVKDLPMIDAQYRFNQCNSFREEHISVFSPYGEKKVRTFIIFQSLFFFV